MSIEASPPCVAHLDADAFYVSVELLRRPELRGQPVVVSGSGPRAVVTTASYEARRYGVGSAMPAARARRLCPQAVFLTPDFAAYREVSGAHDGDHPLARRAGRGRGPRRGLPRPGRAATRPRAAMRRLVAEISDATQLTCSVGIGPNKLVAKVASDAEKPAGFVVLSREQACARFAGSPPALVPGIGPKTAARLAELGLTTLAALGAAPEQVLVERFGPNLGRELAQARALRTRRRGRRRRARSSRSRASGPSNATSTTPRSCARRWREWPASCARASPRTVARGRTIAHQGAPRRLHDGDARAHRRASRRATPSIVSAVALRAARGVRAAAPGAAARACASPASPRPVPRTADPRGASRRDGHGRAAADQLALPV